MKEPRGERSGTTPRHAGHTRSARVTHWRYATSWSPRVAFGPQLHREIVTDAGQGLIVDIVATQAGSDCRQLTPRRMASSSACTARRIKSAVDGGYSRGDTTYDGGSRNRRDRSGPEFAIFSCRCHQKVLDRI
jgi:hypothetical protein